MAQQPSLVIMARAITLEEELRQLQRDLSDAHMHAISNIARQIADIERLVKKAELEHSTHCHVALSEPGLVVATVAEIRKLVDLLRKDTLIRGVQCVILRGPLPDANGVVDPAVAPLADELVAQGFELQEGNTYSVPNHLKGALYQPTVALEALVAAAATPAAADPAPADPAAADPQHQDVLTPKDPPPHQDDPPQAGDGGRGRSRGSGQGRGPVRGRSGSGSGVRGSERVLR